MSEHTTETDAVREDLSRPPCWGPNENGDMMVDMEVSAYVADVNRLAAAAARDLERSLADQHRALCEYALIEEMAGTTCSYTGRVYAPGQEASE